MKSLIKTTLVSTLFVGHLNAANISQTSSNAIHGNRFIGQSFTATGTEDIQSIKVQSSDTGSRTLRIYDSDVLCSSDGTNPTGGAVYSQSVTLASGWVTLTLTTPQAITNGNQYTFCFDQQGTTLWVDTTNPYASGVAKGIRTGRDLAFEIITTPSGGGAGGGSKAVPVGLFGLLALLAGILGSAFVGLRRKKS